MPDRVVADGINSPRTKQILLLFAIPKTPHQAAKELSVRKIKLTPYVREHLLQCLNPECKKGRIYTITKKARQCLGNVCLNYDLNKPWEVIGWVIASPRERLVVLRCVDERKLYSEEIRMKATQFNCKMSRTSIKTILKQLIEKHLVDSEILERIRFYRITSYGQKIKDDLAVLSPLSPVAFGV